MILKNNIHLFNFFLFNLITFTNIHEILILKKNYYEFHVNRNIKNYFISNMNN